MVQFLRGSKVSIMPVFTLHAVLVPWGRKAFWLPDHQLPAYETGLLFSILGGFKYPKNNPCLRHLLPRPGWLPRAWRVAKVLGVIYLLYGAKIYYSN